MTTDTYQHTFTWQGEGTTVVATGDFDQASSPPSLAETLVEEAAGPAPALSWKCSLPPLGKQPDGTFAGQIALPYGQKIAYKYVVDGNWKHNESEPSETDASGNVNNVFTVPEKPELAQIIPLNEPESGLPVPESVATVEGDVSSTVPATTSALPPQAAEPTTQEKASEAASAVQEKAEEVVPQVQESVKAAAEQVQETVGPAASAVGAAIATTATAAAAGLSSLAGSAKETAQDAVPTPPATTRKLSASAPAFEPSNFQPEKPKEPSPTPAATDKPLAEVDSIPMIPSNSFIEERIPDEEKVHSTEVAPKDDASSTTAVAPKYDEHTAVVAKDEAPETIETPLGGTTPQDAPPATASTEGLTAPKEDPEDAPALAAGTAAVGAVIAGVAVLGQKAASAVTLAASQASDSAPSAAQSVVDTTTQAATEATQTTSQKLHEAVQVAEQYLEQAKAGGEQLVGQVSGALGFGQESKSVEDNEATGVPNEDITPLPVSEAPEGPTVPDQVLTALPTSEAPVAAPSEPVSANGALVPAETEKAVVPVETAVVPAETGTTTTVEAPTLPDKVITTLPAEEAPVASDATHATPSSTVNGVKEDPAAVAAPVAVAPAVVSSSLDVPAAAPSQAAQEVAHDPAVVASPDTPLAGQPAGLAPPVAPSEPPSTTDATAAAAAADVKSEGPAFAPRKQPSETTAPETPFSTAPSTPASTLGRKSGAQAALGQGEAPSAPDSPSKTDKADKDRKRKSSFFSRLFSSSPKKA
ncbi:hypothetical protein JCM1840_004033 [Sporobolomyces johnsonii]